MAERKERKEGAGRVRERKIGAGTEPERKERQLEIGWWANNKTADREKGKW